jgi:hypothetical protein
MLSCLLQFSYIWHDMHVQITSTIRTALTNFCVRRQCPSVPCVSVLRCFVGLVSTEATWCRCLLFLTAKQCICRRVRRCACVLSHLNWLDRPRRLGHTTHWAVTAQVCKSYMTWVGTKPRVASIMRDLWFFRGCCPFGAECITVGPYMC